MGGVSPQDAAGTRDAALQVVRDLAEAGHVAYFAGGCVRDALLGATPDDYDVATDARPEQVARLFKRVQRVGESFGIMLVRRRGRTIQVATFRSDGVYRDGRHPEEVTFTDAEHDAERRDFTINGLFEDPIAETIIDFVGGRADLDAGVIRAIGDPAARLAEDHLRMLRAVRFAARLEFRIDPPTADAIRAGASDLAGVSRERIGQEIRRMLGDARRPRAAVMLEELGLDGAVLMEPRADAPPTILSRIPAEADYPTALAAWLLDRHGTDVETGPIVKRWSSALMLSNEDRAALRQSLAADRRLRLEWPTLGIAAQKRLAASTRFPHGLQLTAAIDPELASRVRLEVDELARTGLAPDPLVDGNDLIEAGLEPGPLFARVLERVYDAQLEGRISDRSAALALARRTADELGGGGPS